MKCPLVPCFRPVPDGLTIHRRVTLASACDPFVTKRFPVIMESLYYGTKRDSVAIKCVQERTKRDSVRNKRISKRRRKAKIRRKWLKLRILDGKVRNRHRLPGAGGDRFTEERPANPGARIF
jgi:hypothetical protein